MAYTTINKSSDYFDTKTFTGNGTSQSITNLNFKPSLVWLKDRSTAYAQSLFDLHRGTNARIRTDSSDSQDTPVPSALTAFNSDGFTVGGDVGVNQNNDNIVGWNWYSADTMGSANTDGSLNTYATTANTTAGFSIISYTGTGSNATVGHGLGVVPNVIWVKSLSAGGDWTCYWSVLGSTKFMRLNSTIAAGTQSTYWQDTDPTSSVFSIGTAGDVNGSGTNYIAYCFAEKTGYSKFGKYTGNGSTDGAFVYTGFKPAFLMIKRTSGTDQWILYDTKRETGNVMNLALTPDTNDTEQDTSSYNTLDIVSNGFKCRGGSSGSGTGTNQSGGSYIYMAFASAPLVGTNNIPATAR